MVKCFSTSLRDSIRKFMKFILLVSVLLTFYGKYGNTYKQDDILRLSGKFNLGGLFNLS